MPDSAIDLLEADTPVDSIRKFVIAGWTGRNPEQVRKHIEELRALGVRPPSTVPVFYEVSPASMTGRDELVVVGPDTSGEVEFVLIQTADETLVTVGSDHTDRWLETVSVHHSKQICMKPVCARAWPLRDLAEHWDQLILRAYSVLGGRRRLYQEGTVSGMLAPATLLARYLQVGGEFGPGTAMSCGTLAMREGVEYGEAFEIELEDPARKRCLRHRYRIRTIPIAS